MDRPERPTGTFTDGVLFVEAPGEQFRVAKARLLAVKIKRQNANLPEVKRRLAAQVRAAGGNALVGFRYGQKRTFFQWDEVAWFGEGYAAHID